MVALDWTDFDEDDHTTLSLQCVTEHGRTTPLMWKTIVKSKRKGQQRNVEKELITEFAQLVPEDTEVLLLADRGFGCAENYALLQELGMHYVLRFRGNIFVTDSKGVRKRARDWVPRAGRTKTLRCAKVTEQQLCVPTIVCVKERNMKDDWCLASSEPKALGRALVKYYGKRFSIEETFRDQKCPRFRNALNHVRIADCDRRDRLFIVDAIARALITLLGAACEQVGFDRMLKANTSKTRSHSLFNQGTFCFQALPNMKDKWATPLMKAFDDLLAQQTFFTEIFGVL